MRNVKIPWTELENAVKENMFGMGNNGFCLSCGAEGSGCEPDARNYSCDECGEMEKFGAEEILFMDEYTEEVQA